MSFKVADLYLLAPEFSLVVLALVVMMVDLFVKRRAVIVAVALIGLVVPLAFTISQAITLTGTHRAFFNMLVVDSYSIFFQVVFLIIAVVLILASYDYVGKYVKADGEFYTLLLLSLSGMMFMASTGELISMYISYELASIPLYVMAGMIRANERSAEAAVKYVLLGAMSSAILLYGFALLYGATGTTDLVATGGGPGIAGVVGKSLDEGNVLLLIAEVLILAGIGFKISAVPFHMWAPDIYEGAPTTSTAFFSVGSKAAGFALLFRIFLYSNLWHLDRTSMVIIFAIVAVLTMTLGNVVAAVQSNVKRMMAYSSIAQAGYILVGFTASFASGRPEGVASALFFIMVYVITNLGAFSGIIALGDLTGGERIEDFRGLFKRAPLLSTGTALCLLSLGGIPPVVGFFSKVVLFTASWGLGLNWLVVVALLNSIVSLVYYGRVVKVMFFDAPPKNDHLVTPPGVAVSLAVTTVALLVLTVAVQFLLDPAHQGALSLFAFIPK